MSFEEIQKEIFSNYKNNGEYPKNIKINCQHVSGG